MVRALAGRYSGEVDPRESHWWWAAWVTSRQGVLVPDDGRVSTVTLDDAQVAALSFNTAGRVSGVAYRASECAGRLGGAGFRRRCGEYCR